MNRKLFCLLSLIIILSLVTGSAGVSAQGAQPPRPVVPPGKTFLPRSPGSPLPGVQPLRLQPGAINQANAPSVELGKPGLSYRYVQTFGTLEAPYLDDNTHLNFPVGLTTDQQNSIYILEERGRRVIKFNNTGAFLYKIGVAGLNFNGDYNFDYPQDATVDQFNNLWVAESNRIVKYTSDGTYLQQFPTTDSWQSGAENDRFNTVRGVAFDSHGRMYVSDSNNQRVQIYSFDIEGNPVWLRTLGITGEIDTDNLHFNYPQHIAISNNQLFIADSENHRVQVFDVSSADYNSISYVDTIGVSGQPGDDNQHLDYPFGVAVNSNYIIVSEGNNNRIQVFNAINRQYITTVTTFGTSPGFVWNPRDVALDSSGNLYIADSYNHRVQLFTKGPGNIWAYARLFGTTNVPYLTDGQHFNKPRVAIDPNNNLIILEEDGQRLIKLNPAGSLVFQIGTPGIERDPNRGTDDNFHFRWPHAVGTDNNGNIYVADDNRVQIYNSTGAYIDTIGGTWGDGDYEFQWATGVAVGSNGNIYVSDFPNHRVQIYNSSRTFIGRIGTTGVCDSDINPLCYPLGVDVDSVGNIYVAGGGNAHIQKFNSNLQLLLTIDPTGVWGDGFGQFNWAEDVAVDNQGKIYVADWDNQRIQVFDPNGAFLTSIGGVWGVNSSQFRGVSSVDVDSYGNLFVSDFTNSRIQKYAPSIPGWRQKNINGFGDPNTTGIPALEVFNDQLYAGTFDWSIGARVWRSPDGSSWTAVSEPGFSNVYTNTNPAVLDLIVFDGQLYAGTGWGGIEGQLWRSPDGTTWTNVTDNDFNNPNNQSITLFTIFDDNLYAAAGNPTTGLEIWRSDTGNSSDWDPVVTGGFDSNPNNTNPTGFATFNGYLYVATEGPEDPDGGLEIWRTNTGNAGSWAPVNEPGFGDPDNFSAGGMAVYKGFLYVGIWNTSTGAQIWRTDTGTSWEPVISDGFGDSNNYKIDTLYVFDNKLYAGANNDQTGVEIWRTSDGSNWYQINPDGFGDSNNLAIVLWSNGITSFNDSLYMGTLNNANGGELWQLLKPLYLPIAKR